MLARFTSVAAGNYAAVVVSFVVNIVLTRALGTAEYGRLALLITVSQVLGFAIVNWTFTALVHFGAREFAATGAVGRTFWARLVLAAPVFAVMVVAMVFGRSWIAGWLEVPAWALVIVFVHFLFTAAMTTAGAVLQATDRMHRYAVIFVLDKAVALVLILGVWQVGGLRAWTALGCFAVSALLVSFFAFHGIGRLARLPSSLARERWLEMWQFSFPFMVSTWAGVFGTQWTDYVIMKRYLVLHDLGLYSLAWQIVGVIQQVTVIASALMLPRLSVMVAERRDNELRRIVDRAFPYWLLALAVFLGLAMPVTGALLPVVFGAAFSGAIQPLNLLILATMAMALFNTLSPLLTAHGATWTISAICVASAACNVVMDFVLIPRFGVTGSAAATLVAYALAAGLALAVVAARLHASVGRYGVLAAPTVAAYACTLVLDGAILYPAAVAAVAATAYLVIRMFGLFRQADLFLVGQTDLPGWIRTRLIRVTSGKA